MLYLLKSTHEYLSMILRMLREIKRLKEEIFEGDYEIKKVEKKEEKEEPKLSAEEISKNFSSFSSKGKGMSKKKF